jgi:hypothetical protein
VGVADANVRGVFVDNCSLDLRDTLFDYTANAAGIPRIVSSGQRAGTQPGRQDTYLRDIEIHANSEVVSRTWAPFSGAGHLLRARGLHFSHPFRLMVGEEFVDGSMIDWQCDPIDGITNGVINSSSYTFGNSDLASVLSRLRLSASPSLYVQGRSTISLIAPPLPAGRILGQRLTIHYMNNQSFTLKNGSTYNTKLSSEADVVLTSNMLIELLWDGTVWQDLT